MQKIVTEANLYHAEVMHDIDSFIEHIDNVMRLKGIKLGPEVELVLEPMLSKDGTDIVCGYYFVDHETRCLFWLENFDVSYTLADIKGVKSPAHIKLAIEAQYWYVSLSLGP
jgi:hypothetical protein